jgi:hypothetical protein
VLKGAPAAPPPPPVPEVPAIPDVPALPVRPPRPEPLVAPPAPALPGFSVREPLQPIVAPAIISATPQTSGPRPFTARMIARLPWAAQTAQSFRARDDRRKPSHPVRRGGAGNARGGAAEPTPARAVWPPAFRFESDEHGTRRRAARDAAAHLWHRFATRRRRALAACRATEGLADRTGFPHRVRRGRGVVDGGLRGKWGRPRRVRRGVDAATSGHAGRGRGTARNEPGPIVRVARVGQRRAIAIRAGLAR